MRNIGSFASFFRCNDQGAHKDFANIKEAKAVWDITTGDEKVFVDRMGLIMQKTKKIIRPETKLELRLAATRFAQKTQWQELPPRTNRRSARATGFDSRKITPAAERSRR
ncbi:MAG TPA: hypothetical protein VMV97_02585 [Sulfuriferula sp.]|nr:hypothetical protein [Sulfuriferula sp.]